MWPQYEPTTHLRFRYRLGRGPTLLILPIMQLPALVGDVSKQAKRGDADRTMMGKLAINCLERRVTEFLAIFAVR
jgi:hypothetical protein